MDNLSKQIAVRRLMNHDNGISFGDAIDKGCRLASFFKSAATASEWNDPASLEKYGWDKDYHVPLFDTNGAPNSWDGQSMATYQDLGLSPAKEDNVRVPLKHVNPRRTDRDYSYPATNGYYICVYNPLAIIVRASWSPWIAGAWLEPPIPDHEVVPLSHWSDIVFLQWQRYCSEAHVDPSDLRVIVQSHVTNDTTLRIITSALKHARMDLCEWQSEYWKKKSCLAPATFPFGTPEYYALLATPNGVGPVHFLTQHQNVFGKKLFEGVTVFGRDDIDFEDVSLCFHIAPVFEKGEE